MIKQQFLAFIVFLIVFISFFPISVQSRDVEIKLFYGAGCPACARTIKFLEKLHERYPEVDIEMYEVWYNKTNRELRNQLAAKHNMTINIVPVIFINNHEPIIGYVNDETTGKKIEEIITSDFREGGRIVDLPIFGRVDVGQIGLLTFTIMIGILDGFNPCAMWVLIFLLTLLVVSGSRKRIFLIGGAFIFVSGFVYFLFMIAWLNVFLFIGYMDIIRYAIGALAIGFGIISIKYYFYQKICSVSIPGARNFNIFNKMRNLIEMDIPLYVVIAWIMVLAVGVNMIELMCTAGFPAIYTKILTSYELPAIKYYNYLFVYILFYMIDDLLIFFAVIITMSSEKFTHKYGKISKFVGGLAILILGIIMIFNPALLVFA